MSVTEVTPVTYRLFSGYDNPALPLGTWICSAFCTGDGSGGQRLIQVDFDPGTVNRSTLYYSIEEFLVSDSDNNAKAGNISVYNLETVAGTTINRYWRVSLDSGYSTAVLRAYGDTPIPPAWIGAQGAVGVPSSLLLRMPNVSSAVLSCVVGGYFWGPRSTNVEGGPMRPAVGFYRN